MSFFDGCLGYNHILVEEEDRLKNSFMTKWGTFSYRGMSFGLINVRVAFEWAMNETFKGLINKCIVIYMDDLMVFSKDQSTQIAYWRQVFKKCRKYSTSFNPKKCSFGVTKGKLLHQIISKARISIYFDRFEAILKLSPPYTQKELKSFFLKINFVWKFISGFADIVCHLNDLLKKRA